MKRSLLALICVMTGAAAMAHYEDMPINTGIELRDWCEAVSEASFIGKGIRPSNWSATVGVEGNVLLVKGSWRIDSQEVTVECRVARGAQTRYASIVYSGGP